MSNHRKQITAGAVLSYVHIAIGAVITLLYTPFMIRILGKNEYGLYNTVAAIVSTLSILSLGFGNSYVRFFSQYRAEDKQEEIKKLNGMFLIIFSVIGLVALLCGLFLTFHLELVFDRGLTEEEFGIARKLMLLLTFNLAVSFPASVFTSIITAHERFIYQKTLNLVRQVASPLIQIPILLMGYASVGMVVCTVVINLIIDLLNIFFCLKKLKVGFAFRHFDLSIFKGLAVYSVFIAINMIVDQINLHIDKVLLGRFCGTASVAVYSAGFSLYVHYHSFSTSISNVFTPRIHHIWSDTKLTEEEKDNRLSEIFANVGRIQFMILLLVCSGLVIFGKQFIVHWVGKNFTNSYYVVIILAISAIVPLTQNVGIEIQRAKNKHQFRSIIYGLMAIVNLVLSIYLCQLYGEVGSAIGTAVSFIVANTIIMDIFYQKVLDIHIGLYWKQVIRTTLSVVPAFIIGYSLCRLFDTYAVRYLLLCIILYTLSYLICLYMLGMSSDEKRAVLILVKKIGRKVNGGHRQ